MIFPLDFRKLMGYFMENLLRISKRGKIMRSFSILAVLALLALTIPEAFAQSKEAIPAIQVPAQILLALLLGYGAVRIIKNNSKK